jgi:hypothetical protein
MKNNIIETGTGCKMFLMVCLLVLAVSFHLKASKGGGEEKSKKGVVLKVKGFEMKKTYMTPRSLMNIGATYKGTLTPMAFSKDSKVLASTSLVTYERGNTIFIYPLQQKPLLQKFKLPSK